ncbi:MAG: RNB domain-containing ribonuclease, partial [Marinovum sp.]|nr:RNB domain-containing ribonuclease [Marinovum sp.]
MSKPPNKADIIAWISANPMQIGRRDIAKAFGIKGSGKIKLKRILKEMESEGVYGATEKDNQAMQQIDSQLPPVSVLSVAEIDENGDLFATPVDWQQEDTPPRILMAIGPEAIPLGVGDQILARVTPISDQEYQYEAKLIRRKEKAQIKTLGVYRLRGAIGRIVPIDKSGKEWRVATADANGAKDGELVEAVRSGSKSRLGLQRARVVRRLGNPSAPKAVSLIAIHQHNIPDTFSEQVLEEARVSGQRKLVEHEDLCHLPFVTIDPEGARDHDDAVFAQADSDRDNMGGHLIWVAIADVAHYVRLGTALNEAARKRGNSTYFPDRVVPMLPEALSADLCSLHQGAKRPCLVVCLKIDSKGKKINHEFHRAIICSVSSLTYEEVQRGIEGAPNDRVSALLDTVISPLYAAYSSLCFERQERQPLDLELPERVICLDKNGDVTSVKFKDRLDAHRLIEEFMIMANVAAAECLAAKKEPCLFRIHEEPDKEKIEALRDTAQSVGLNLAKGAALRT